MAHQAIESSLHFHSGKSNIPQQRCDYAPSDLDDVSVHRNTVLLWDARRKDEKRYASSTSRREPRGRKAEERPFPR